MNDKITINGKEYDTTADGLPMAAHDLPRDNFPLLVRYLREEDGKGLGQGELLGWHVVTDMEIMRVPGYGKDGTKVTVSLQSANGQATMVTSDGQEYVADMTPEMIEAVHTIADKVISGELEDGHMPPTEENPRD